jgi:hypothetical protein
MADALRAKLALKKAAAAQSKPSLSSVAVNAVSQKALNNATKQAAAQKVINNAAAAQKASSSSQQQQPQQQFTQKQAQKATSRNIFGNLQNSLSEIQRHKKCKGYIFNGIIQPVIDERDLIINELKEYYNQQTSHAQIKLSGNINEKINKLQKYIEILDAFYIDTDMQQQPLSFTSLKNTKNLLSASDVIGNTPLDTTAAAAPLDTTAAAAPLDTTAAASPAAAGTFVNSNPKKFNIDSLDFEKLINILFPDKDQNKEKFLETFFYWYEIWDNFKDKKGINIYILEKIRNTNFRELNIMNNNKLFVNLLFQMSLLILNIINEVISKTTNIGLSNQYKMYKKIVGPKKHKLSKFL